ncbi:hypothetical protein DDZ14_14520 [Maritimibacter sp. 55A14]|uniref:GTA head formation protein, RCAP_rcc01685 family n=1 Tax=Maritimibacter sp. 55A14 TaxID=2174844 RepID=UPI000D616F89|nr:hypothetical protein [Maritimibacter sp. 55A14]PWE30644.1 hypothetical protein DDZ14_14520 [Maritimibacter sp. 55A14]
MTARPKGTGSRFLYEPFDPTAARLEANERVLDERWSALERRLQVIETVLERVEKRLWLAVFAVASFVLTQGAFSLLKMIP